MMFEDVKKEGAKLLIMLAGLSGGGKTYTGLQLAKGLANGDMGRVAFIDTENGRGRLYADNFPVPYKYGEMIKPFSPARFVAAIEAAEQQLDCDVLVIDSGSHEWEATGGVWDIAHENPRYVNWNKGKAEHKKFMNKLLSSKFHIILCLRAKEKTLMEKTMKNGKETIVYRSLGLYPTTEKNVMYEATVSLMVGEGGMAHYPIKPLPKELQPILGRGHGYITEEDGMALRKWIDGGGKIDKEFSVATWTLREASEKGLDALKACWASLPSHVWALFGNKCPDNLKQAALAVDEIKLSKLTMSDMNEEQVKLALEPDSETGYTPEEQKHEQS